MNRIDRAILWVGDRVPPGTVLAVMTLLVWVPLAWAAEQDLHGHGLLRTAVMLVEIAGGGLIGHLSARWDLRWRKRHGFDRCSDCWRIGRWAIRLTLHDDDSLAIPEPPPWCNTGCWCQKRATDHLVRFLQPEKRPYFSEIALVPYDRHGGQLVPSSRPPEQEQ